MSTTPPPVEGEPPPGPGMFGLPGRVLDEMPEELRNVRPAPPPDFSEFRRRRREGPPTGNGSGPGDPLGLMGAAGDEAEEPEGPEEDDEEGQEAFRGRGEIDVRAWLSGFRFQPGVSYIVISRRYPQVWKGYTTGGYLEQQLEPFDTTWIAGRWGGGTFDIEVFQPNRRGQPARAEARTITISGNPAYYRGPQGEPVPIPTEMSGGQGPGQGPGQGFGPGASPVYAWQGRWAGAPPDRGALGAIDERRHELKVAEQMAALAREAGNAKADAATSQLAAIQAQLADERKAREDGTTRIVAPLQATVEAVRVQLEQQRGAFERALAEQRQTFEAAMKDAATSHASVVESMRHEHETQLSSRETEARRHEEMMAKMQATEIAGYQARVTSAEASAKDIRDNIERLLAARYEAQIAALNAEITRVREDRDAQVARATKDGEREEKHLRDELALLRDELAKTRADKGKSITDNMTEFAGAMAAWQNVAGSMGFEKGAQEPSGFLGQLAAHGPALRSAVIDPVMQRVDNIASAVRERTAAEQQARASAVQARMAALPMGVPMAAFPVGPAGPMQQALPMGHSIAGQEPHVPSHAPSPAVRPQAPQPPPPPAETDQGRPMTAAEIQEASEQLVRFLETQYEADVQPKAVAAALQTMLAPQAFESLRMTPSDQAVQQVVGLAGPDSPLTSPRAAAWLASIHAAAVQVQ